MNNNISEASLFLNAAISMIFTMFAYGGFPIIFAKTKKGRIKASKYRGLCYGINAIPMSFFLISANGVYNAAPYLIWTLIFSKIGIKMLTQRGILEESQVVTKDEIKYTCTACGYEDTKSYKNCPNCGTYMNFDNRTTDDTSASLTKKDSE